jgi:2'-5' RNA ligase
MPFEKGQTAIVVEVPAAEPVVGRWRDRYDESSAFGVPAHVTVLVPFLDIGLVDDAVVAELRAIVVARPAFEVWFRGCARFRDDVLYLAPEPAGPLRDLTNAVVARWPEAPPYGGQFGTDVVPHLTVAHDVDAETLATVERDVTGRLPVHADVEEAWLLHCDGARWLRHTRLPLAPAHAGERAESGHTAG